MNAFVICPLMNYILYSRYISITHSTAQSAFLVGSGAVWQQLFACGSRHSFGYTDTQTILYSPAMVLSCILYMHIDIHICAQHKRAHLCRENGALLSASATDRWRFAGKMRTCCVIAFVSKSHPSFKLCAQIIHAWRTPARARAEIPLTDGCVLFYITQT